SNRKWAWANLRRPRRYPCLVSFPESQFATPGDAAKVAKEFAKSSTCDRKGAGGAWSQYVNTERQLEVQQGDASLPKWLFPDLASAQKEAKKWANVHVIDLSTNEWVWDNITPQRKEELRAGSGLYQIYIDGFSEAESLFSYLEDAV